MKGIWFDLYGEYKTKEQANKEAKILRSKKTHLVRVVRDYYWTDNTTYSSWVEKNSSGVKQIRVSKYNNNSTWSIVDGNDASSGINFNYIFFI